MGECYPLLSIVINWSRCDFYCKTILNSHHTYIRLHPLIGIIAYGHCLLMDDEMIDVAVAMEIGIMTKDHA